MKKVLLATTALVATAGFAAAEITITGGANMGLRYIEDAGAGNNDSDITTHTEIDFNIVASGTSDSGVEFGASMDVDGGERDQGTTQGVANDPEVYASYNGFKVTMGAVGNAGIVLNTADVGFDGLNTDTFVDILDSDELDVFDMDVHASYTISGITIAASVGSDSQDMGVSVSGEFSGVSFGLGYAKADEDQAVGGMSATTLGVGYAMGAVDVQANIAQIDAFNDATAYGLSVAYTSGAMTVTGALSSIDVDGAPNIDMAMGVGVAYDLGGGLAVKAGIGQVPQGDALTGWGDAVTVADLGLTMSF